MSGSILTPNVCVKHILDAFDKEDFGEMEDAVSELQQMLINNKTPLVLEPDSALRLVDILKRVANGSF